MSVFDIMASPFDPWITHRRPSVYVISDSEMKAYKQKQAKQEIEELLRLVDIYKTRIENLEQSISGIEKEYPQLLETYESA